VKRGSGGIVSEADFMKRLSLLIIAVSTAGSCLAAGCEGLAGLSLPQGAVTSARQVAAGAFVPPGNANQGAAGFNDLPGFCRVTATLRPSNASDIRIEVWLPVSGWNGKLEGSGNGGYGGAINHAALAAAVRRGYAVAGTDTGHAGDSRDASFAYHHPDKLIDFGYRAVHEMTGKAKAIAKAYYGQEPKLSYWVGCSTGGRQALEEAQQYPEDYDAIVAGAPGNNTAQLATQALAIAQAVHKDEASYIPPSLYPVIHNAVLATCDQRDGVKDGLLTNPSRCVFDPKVLECKAGADPTTCLSKAQVATVRSIYNPLRSLATKPMVPLGLQPGSELGWANMAGPGPFFYADQFWKYMVVEDPNWNYKMLNIEKALALTTKMEHERGDAASPNLQAFFAHGGKLLQYHGWSDQNIPPENSINYYKKVLDTLGGAAVLTNSYRLFMVPGMAHCGGGEGPNNFDMLGALEHWREQGKAPAQIVASKVVNGVVERTLPLCPYPQAAVYKGSGDTWDRANFMCKAQ
jgi:feruloyl esterase